MPALTSHLPGAQTDSFEGQPSPRILAVLRLEKISIFLFSLGGIFSSTLVNMAFHT